MFLKLVWMKHFIQHILGIIFFILVCFMATIFFAEWGVRILCNDLHMSGKLNDVSNKCLSLKLSVWALLCCCWFFLWNVTLMRWEVGFLNGWLGREQFSEIYVKNWADFCPEMWRFLLGFVGPIGPFQTIKIFHLFLNLISSTNTMSF